MERGGYLRSYGLWEWYDAQPKAVQEYLYMSCGYGVGTDPRRLQEGDVEVLSLPDDPYQPSATTFLCLHARNALGDKNDDVCRALLRGARQHIQTPADREYYDVVTSKMLISYGQEES